MKLQLLNKEEFSALSPAKKRVAIAKDVIQRDRANLFDTSWTGFFNEVHDTEFRESNPQEYFNQKTCHVCAKGAIMCSWVGNFNSYSADDVRGFDFIFHDTRTAKRRNLYPKELIDIFGIKMLDLIEAEFEGWKTATCKYKRNLRAIMENVVANKGKFVP